jgi:hypothetical protein
VSSSLSSVDFNFASGGGVGGGGTEESEALFDSCCDGVLAPPPVPAKAAVGMIVTAFEELFGFGVERRFKATGGSAPATPPLASGMAEVENRRFICEGGSPGESLLFPVPPILTASDCVRDEGPVVDMSMLLS